MTPVIVFSFRLFKLSAKNLTNGLELFGDDLKKDIASYMKRIDENGNEVYLDLSGYSVVTSTGKEVLDGPWIPYTDYFNVEKPLS